MDRELFLASLGLEQRANQYPPSRQNQVSTNYSLDSFENKVNGSRDSDDGGVSKTKQLAKWIERVRRKKSNCHKKRTRNLRIEAVLTYALSNAEYELRAKQLARISKLKKVQGKLSSKSDKFYNENQNYSDLICQLNNQNQEEPLCQELSSLEDFMEQISKIKVPLQR